MISLLLLIQCSKETEGVRVIVYGSVTRYGPQISCQREGVKRRLHCGDSLYTFDEVLLKFCI